MNTDAGAISAPSAAPASTISPQAQTVRPEAARPEEIPAELRRLWEEGLRVGSVAADADFFDLGGTSLDLIRLFGQINETYGLALDGSVLDDAATLTRLVAAVEAARREKC